MARSSVYQQKTCFTVPRDPFLRRVVFNKKLSKKDLRVAMLLFTKLDGINEKHPDIYYRDDNRNGFAKISVSKIADELEMDKSDVKESLRVLEEEHIIETGSNEIIKTGYRFTF